MGAGASTISVSIKKGIESDYNRVKQDPERDYIVLEEVCMVRPPPGIPITFSSLGVLYATDKNGDGRFSLQELYEFAQLCDTQRKLVQSYEFQSHMQALCLYTLWTDAINKGMKYVEDWLVRLVRENGEVQTFGSHPNVAYISRDSILPLYKVIRLPGVSFQDFFDLLQHAGEEAGLMSVEEEEFDDVVPEPTFRLFAAHLLAGLQQILRGVFAEQHLSPMPPPTVSSPMNMPTRPRSAMTF